MSLGLRQVRRRPNAEHGYFTRSVLKTERTGSLFTPEMGAFRKKWIVLVRFWGEDADKEIAIDTLCLSPLLFPMRPYHALIKDDKLQSDSLNNPLNDSIKPMDDVKYQQDMLSVRRQPHASTCCGLIKDAD